MSEEGELWSLASNNRIFSENGKLIATFSNKEDAENCIDDHNLEIELNQPEEPEVKKSREETVAAKLAEWKQYDPEGYRLLELIISNANRIMRFLSLKAPEFLIARELKLIQERTSIMQELHPMPVGFDNE